MDENKLTCVSGYWNIKNKHGNNFDKWFQNTLKINCPYVFFSDKETINLIKKYREDLPTYYIECNIDDFYTYKFRDRMITDPEHSPSIELKLIWNEKIFLVQKAFKINPFNSEYFAWVDAGICCYREKPPPKVPFPNLDKLRNLPNDKFIFTSIDDYERRCKMKPDSLYFTMLYVIGTSYLLHKDIINNFVEIYKHYLDKLVDKSIVWTDQIILTHIYKDFPQLFYKLSEGWGNIVPELY